MKRAVFLLTLALCLSGVQPLLADGQFAASSELNPWGVTASGMVEGGEGTANRTASLDCAGVHQLYQAYRSAAPWETDPDAYGRVELYDLTTTEIGWLLAFHGLPQTRIDIDTSAGPVGYQIGQCTTIHNTGWLPATAGVINAVGYPPGVLDPELGGNVPSCDYGEILLAAAHFVHNGSQWVFAYGRDVSNDFSSYELTADSTIDFICQSFFDPTEDIVDLADAVPAVQVNYNPLVQGLTGLDTWLWYDFSQPGTPSQLNLIGQVSSRGIVLDIDATAWIDRVAWDMDCETDCGFRGMALEFDDGGIDIGIDGDTLSIDFDDSPTRPATIYDGGRGTEEDAPGKYLYEEKRRYTVSTVTWWRGVFDVTVNGTPSSLGYLYDPVIVAGERPYEVVEIRGVLTTLDR